MRKKVHQHSCNQSDMLSYHFTALRKHLYYKAQQTPFHMTATQNRLPHPIGLYMYTRLKRERKRNMRPHKDHP
uniref:Uncharacterized protein n=1 Tax=Rhizophora mucronata TaxID=61149 RepID=A0A2P2KF78_RHIMU